jgi:alpha-methylacyl-CoA racemase
LAGIRVIEFAAAGPTAFCGMMLADLGACVLRLGRMGQHRLPFEPGLEHDVLLSNRPTLDVDLKRPSGLKIARALLLQADALIEGYRPGVMERLGLGPDEVGRLNSRLVYGRGTGWGQTGPYARRAGHDLNFLGQTGVLACLGEPGRPPSIPLNLVADFGGGGMLLALGVLAALWRSAVSGRGQTVDAAMVDGVSALMASVRSMANAGKWDDGRCANVLDGGAPWYSSYETLDRKYIAVACVEPQFFRKFMVLMGLDGQFAEDQFRRSAWPAMSGALRDAFRKKERACWCDLLGRHDICFSPVLSLSEALEDEHMRERYARDHNGAVRHSPAPRFGRTPCAPPGGHTMAGRTVRGVLLDWGVDSASFDAASAAGAVAPAFSGQDV